MSALPYRCLLCLLICALTLAGQAAAPQAASWTHGKQAFCATLTDGRLHLGRVVTAGIEDAGTVPSPGITTIATSSSGVLGAQNTALMRLDVAGKRWTTLGTLPAPILQILPAREGAMLLTGSPALPPPTTNAVWWARWTPKFTATRVEAIGKNDCPWQLWWAEVPGERRLAAATYRATQFAQFEHNCMFLYTWKNGKTTPCWLGSRLSRPYQEAAHADLRADGKTRMVALEVTRNGGLGLSVYTPIQFGYANEWRTETLPGLEHLTTVGSVVLCRGHDTEGNAWTSVLLTEDDGYALTPLSEALPVPEALAQTGPKQLGGWWNGAWHAITIPGILHETVKPAS
jgi:hypothetical protein